MATLQQDIIAYVDSATPQNDPSYRAERASSLLNSGQCYQSSDNVLCIRACAASQSFIRTSKLPTRISAAANTVLTGLQELLDRGVLTASGLKIHDASSGATIQVIP